MLCYKGLDLDEAMMHLWQSLNAIPEFRTAKSSLVNGLASRLGRPLGTPEVVTILLTHGCNLHCRMCGCGEAGPSPEGGGYVVAKKDEMTLGEWKRVVDELAEWGVKNLILSGGEVLLRRDDALALVRHASGLGLNVTVVTNAFGFRPEVCREFADAGMTNFTTSIDGARPRTHDRIRGREGSWRHVVDALATVRELRLERPGLSTNTTTVVQKGNFRELVDIFALLEELGVNCIMFQAVSGDYPPLMIAPEEMGDFQTVLAELKAIKRRGGAIHNSIEYLDLLPRYYREKLANAGRFRLGDCIAGYSGLILSPHGGVDICGFGPFGVSTKTLDVRRLWLSEEFREARRRIAGCERQCLYLCYPKVSYAELSVAMFRVVARSVREAVSRPG